MKFNSDSRPWAHKCGEDVVKIFVIDGLWRDCQIVAFGDDAKHFTCERFMLLKKLFSVLSSKFLINKIQKDLNNKSPHLGATDSSQKLKAI